jgi:CBS domain-containing protein
MGSGGRQETTFVTDQDNALIWADTTDLGDTPARETEGGNHPHIKEWFSEFGKQVSTLLDEYGYQFCKGDNMVKNPRWLMPLSEWKALFHQWMTSPQSEEIIRLQIFFDFRCVYGESGLSNELRQYVLDESPNDPVFLWNLAQSCVDYKIPMDVFRTIRTNPDSDKFDIKNSTRLVVDLARLYSLAHGVREVNTLTRLHRLYEKGILSSTQHRSASQIFENLSQLRLRHQYHLIENGYPPNNLIDLNELSDIDKDTLRHLLDQIRSMQNWIKRDYKGVT